MFHVNVCEFIEIIGRFRGSPVFRLVHRPPDGSCLPPCYYYWRRQFLRFRYNVLIENKISQSGRVLKTNLNFFCNVLVLVIHTI